MSLFGALGKVGGAVGGIIGGVAGGRMATAMYVPESRCYGGSPLALFGTFRPQPEKRLSPMERLERQVYRASEEGWILAGGGQTLTEYRSQ